VNSENVIEVKNLRKSFKNNEVLKGVNFRVKKGEIFALLGSNGAGKTTTIRILSTVIRPCSGEAKICGFDVVEKSEKVRQSISLTGQFAAVDEVLTGRENLIIIAELRGIKNAKNATSELIEKFDMKEFADRRVSTYSGGMRRRLDISMGLLGDPQVIFLDEPTTGLDPQVRKQMWKIIKEMADSGKAVFLTTQYLEEAEQLADYIAILHEGVIATEGTLAKLKKMIPGWKPVMIESSPSLEDVFMALIDNKLSNGSGGAE
jgi:ABC-2 type transport system ATP-binding protein